MEEIFVAAQTQLPHAWRGLDGKKDLATPLENLRCSPVLQQRGQYFSDVHIK